MRSLLILLCSAAIASLPAAEFTKLPDEKLEQLKAATTTDEWSALMPEGQMHVYKEVGDQKLPLYFFPAGGQPETPPGVLVLFAGGAFRNGSPTGLYRQALDYSRNGMPVVTVKYRGTETDGAPVIEAYRDGRDAIAWIRENADKLGVNPDKIVAGGSSAGSILALALATIGSLHEEAGNENGRPNGLLLYDHGGGASAFAPIEGDPQFTPEPKGAWNWYTEERFGADPITLSPFHHLHDDLPPAAIFMGGREKERVRYGAWLLYSTALSKGADWDLHFYADMPHAGMVNSATWQPQVYRSVVENSLRFLKRHEFMAPGQE